MMVEVSPISVEQLNEKMIAQENFYLLDVRNEWEYSLCHLPHSIHIPLKDLEYKLELLPLNMAIIVLCHHGVRSLQAASFLVENGFKEVFNLEGGIHQWAKKIDSQLVLY